MGKKNNKKDKKHAAAANGSSAHQVAVSVEGSGAQSPVEEVEQDQVRVNEEAVVQSVAESVPGEIANSDLPTSDSPVLVEPPKSETDTVVSIPSFNSEKTETVPKTTYDTLLAENAALKQTLETLGETTISLSSYSALQDEIEKLSAEKYRAETDATIARVEKMGAVEDYEGMEEERDSLREELEKVRAEVESVRREMVEKAKERLRLDETVRIAHERENDELRAQIEILRSAAAAAAAAAAAQKSSEASEGSEGAGVEELRRELAEAKENVQLAEEERDKAEQKHRELLQKVKTMRSTLGERLKSDAEELETLRSQLTRLETENKELKQALETVQEEFGRVSDESDELSREVAKMRSESDKGFAKWTAERQSLVTKSRNLDAELASANKTLSSLESLLQEERSLREGFEARVGELEEEVHARREAFEELMGRREQDGMEMERLRGQVKEAKEAREREVREIEERLQGDIDRLVTERKEFEERATDAEAKLTTAKADLEKLPKLQADLKEKTLALAKARHESIILNEHLTKALRLLKRSSSSSNSTVDRQLVTNLVLKFLSLPRGDARKFEALGVLGGFLGWTEEERGVAGLARPSGNASGAAAGGLMSPGLQSPLGFRRVSSTSALSAADYFPPAGRDESMSDLWIHFLEKEAEAGRTPSVSEGPDSSAIASADAK
ncbi:hypothetical protein SAICODRAFT_7599 [Saitoella complicata NRRL Y-17804]|nr:uncharacterized protein SAICODRAFT_7599 [Saitoella complicata NRRL Y-17804]ODQ53001.1 hypothetical protein SAICODRAFT_7599 [Saitoella complicata NRRL Y-17804]